MAYDQEPIYYGLLHTTHLYGDHKLLRENNEPVAMLVDQDISRIIKPCFVQILNFVSQMNRAAGLPWFAFSTKSKILHGLLDCGPIWSFIIRRDLDSTASWCVKAMPTFSILLRPRKKVPTRNRKVRNSRTFSEFPSSNNKLLYPPILFSID